MKKMIFTVLVCSAIGFTASAQEQNEKVAPPMAQNQMMTKEQREAMKQKREAEMNEAFNAAELTDAQKSDSREAMEMANKSKRELRNDASLSDDQKKEKMKAIDEEQKAKLAKIMGEEKFKKFREYQKKAKESMMKNAPARPEN